MISESSIKEFKDIYEKVFGERLTDKEAYLKANMLLNLYKAIYFDNEPCLKLEKRYNEFRRLKVEKKLENKELWRKTKK